MTKSIARIRFNVSSGGKGRLVLVGGWKPPLLEVWQRCDACDIRHFNSLGIWFGEEIQLRPVILRQVLLGLRRQGQIEPQALGESLACFGSKSFVVIPYKCPNIAHFGAMALYFQRPAFQGRFPLPK